MGRRSGDRNLGRRARVTQHRLLAPGRLRMGGRCAQAGCRSLRRHASRLEGGGRGRAPSSGGNGWTRTCSVRGRVSQSVRERRRRHPRAERRRDDSKRQPRRRDIDRLSRIRTPGHGIGLPAPEHVSDAVDDPELPRKRQIRRTRPERSRPPQKGRQHGLRRRRRNGPSARSGQ